MRQVVLYPGEDGKWVAEAPSLPGVVSQGETRDEALANVRDAIESWIEAMRSKGEPIPPERFDVEVCLI